MKPIVLTRQGETLLEDPSVHPAHVPDADDPEAEGQQMRHCVGLHDVCQGWVDHCNVSATHCALRCRMCGLRFVFPNTIKTFGELRKHCEERLKAPAVEITPAGNRPIPEGYDGWDGECG